MLTYHCHTLHTRITRTCNANTRTRTSTNLLCDCCYTVAATKERARELETWCDTDGMIRRQQQQAASRANKMKGQTPESGIPPSDRAIRRYTKVHLDFCLRFSTLIGQIGRVPLFGARPRRYVRSRLFRLAVTVSGVPLPLPGGKKGSESRSFLGPFALQIGLRILRP